METQAVAAYFEAFGYAVDTACRASEALTAAAARPPDLLVADVNLAGSRSGLDVVRELRARQSGLPVIVVTGLSDSELESRGPLPEDAVLLKKPVRLLELAARVEALLDRPPQHRRGADPSG